jgi:DNA-binding transcriptional LysR family regulator
MLNLTHLKVLAAIARHGSVTEAARELHYSQSSVSHHLGRLEADTGARLIQRVGRGIRLTPEGELLARRATEILGRVNAAAVELAARVGLFAGRVRLAGFQTVLSTLVPKAATALSRSYPGIELNLVDAHPAVGLDMLRSGHVDIALIFRNADTASHEEDGFRLTHLLDDALYLISDRPHQRLENHRDSAWVGGCERCRAATTTACRRAVSPRASPSPATTQSSPRQWWPPGWALRSSTGSRCVPTGRRASTPPGSPTAPARSTPPRTVTRRTHPPRPR